MEHLLLARRISPIGHISTNFREIYIFVYEYILLLFLWIFGNLFILTWVFLCINFKCSSPILANYCIQIWIYLCINFKFSSPRAITTSFRELAHKLNKTHFHRFLVCSLSVVLFGLFVSLRGLCQWTVLSIPGRLRFFLTLRKVFSNLLQPLLVETLSLGITFIWRQM